MSSTTEEQLQVTTEPNVMELEQEFKRAYTDQKITHRVRDADETRYALWDGQNRDGKKHAADIGVKAFPWEGASDTRIRLADEVCKFIVNLKMTSVARSVLNVRGTETRDDENAAGVGLYLRWMLSTLLNPEWDEELELHAEYAAQYGWSVLHTTWDRRYAQVPRTITLETLAGFLSVQDPQKFDTLAAAIQEEGTQEEMASLIAAANEGLSFKKALKHIKELAKTGTTTFEETQMVRNQPCITALRPYHEILIPPETTDWRRARVIFRRDYYTTAEIEEKKSSEEWDADFCDMIKKTTGQHSQIWDSGYSPVLGETDRVEDRSNMVEVVYAYSRRADERGNVGIYQTVFSPYLTKDNRGAELYGVHELVTEAGDQYPFEFFMMERSRRAPLESRGIPELIRTWQTEYKAQADQVFDRTTFDTLPPLKVSLRYGQRLKIGPGAQIPETRPGDIGWMESPSRGPEISFQTMEEIIKRVDRYFGRSNPEIPPGETQIQQQVVVSRWLRHQSNLICRIWELVQRFDSDERYAKVTGTGEMIPRDPGMYNFQMHFDVREMDNEFVEKKLQAISNFILPEDNLGVIDRVGLIRKKLQVIDPSLAEELITDNAEASQKMFNDVKSQVAYMSLGNQAEYVENDPTANIKMQFLNQIIQANPKYMEQYQNEPMFKELVDRYVQNLNMSVMQQQNKQIGRIGVNQNA
jgi:hypothetical protein